MIDSRFGTDRLATEGWFAPTFRAICNLFDRIIAGDTSGLQLRVRPRALVVVNCLGEGRGVEIMRLLFGQ